MGNVLIGIVATFATAYAVLAVIAIRAGWLPPWLRRRTLRPALWGYATLLGAAGLCLLAVALTTRLTIALDLAAIALLLAGMALQFLATRPGRVHP